MDILSNTPSDEDLVDIITAERDRAEDIEAQVAVDAGEAPPPAISDEDLVDIAVGNQQRAEQIGTSLAVEQNKSINPEEQARAIPIAERERLPVDVVRRNLDKFENKPIDVERLQSETPSLAKIATTPHGAVSQFDLDTMSTTERALRKFTGTVATLGKGIAANTGRLGLGFLQGQYATREGQKDIGAGLPSWFSEEDRARATATGQQVSETLRGLSTNVTQAQKELEDTIGYTPITDFRRDIKDTFFRGEIGRTLANIPGFAGEQLVTSLPNMVLAMLNPVLSFQAETGRIAQERAGNDNRDFVTTGDVQVSALAGALITFGERLGVSRMLDPGTGLLAPVRGFAAEGGTEFVQEAAESAAATVGTEKGFNLAETVEAGIAGLIGGGPAGAAVATVTATIEAYRVRAEARQQGLIDLGDRIRNSKVNQISPETIVAHAKQMDADGAAPVMSAPVEKLIELFQSEGLTAEQVQAQFPEVARAIDDAAQGAAEVPLNAESIVRLARLEGFSSITGDIRTAPDELTANEAKAEAAKMEEFVGSLTEQDQKAAVFASLEAEETKRLVAAGMEPRAAAVNARLHASVMTRLAEESGKTVDQLLAERNLSIVREGQGQQVPDAVLMQSAKAAGYGEPAIRINGQVVKASDFFPNWERGSRPAGGEGMSIADEQAMDAVDLGPGMPEDPFWGHTDLLAKAREMFGQDVVDAAIESDPEAGFGMVNAAGDFRSLKAQDRGTFDPRDPNILFQGDPPISAEEELDEAIDDLDEAVEDEGYVGARVDQVDALVDDKDIPVITLQDLVGKKIFPTIADRTAAAALYRGIDGSQLDIAIPLLGGPYFPLRVTNWLSNIVWANRGKGVTSQKAARLKDGANYMLVVMGDANMHQSNTTVSRAFFGTLQAYARDGRVKPEGLKSLGKMIADKAAETDPVVTLKSEKALAKAAERTEPLVYRGRVLDKTQGVNKKQAKMKADLEAFPGFDDTAKLDAYLDGISFDARKEILRIMGTTKARSFGVPSMEKILNATIQKQLAGHRWGDGVLLVELDQQSLQVDLGTQGTMPHPDFPLGIRGRVVGKLNTPINYETLWGDWLKQTEAEAKAKNIAEGTPDKPVNVRRAFELSKPIVEVTQQMADKIGKLAPGNIESHRQARLAADFALGNWRVSGKTKQDGGISTQGFIDALAASEASATLSPPEGGFEGKGGVLYTADEVEKRTAIYEVTETVYSAASKETGKRMSAGVEIKLVDGQPRAFKKGEDITGQVDITGTEKVLKDAVVTKVRGKITVTRNGENVTKQVTAREVAKGDFTFVKGTNERVKVLDPAQLIDRQVKNGTLLVKQLGDGEIYYALKNGSDYGWAGVPELPGDKTLTSVVSNELGANGIAGPAVLLDAIANGATVLDCFAVKSKNYPNGFLPALYSAFGFEVVGKVPFNPEFFSGNLKDAEAYWENSKWNRDDGYPDVVVMRWKGTDADRKGILERYLRSGLEGLLAGGARPNAAAAAAEFDDPDLGAAGSAGPADVGRAAGDPGAGRAASLASRSQSIVRDIANLTDQEARNLGLDPKDRDKVANLLANEQAPSPGPSSSGETTTLFQPFDGQGAPEASKAAQALADLKQTGFVTDQHVIGILGEFPGYLQEVAKFMAEQRQKLIDGRMTLRDIAKAYFITVSSMGSGAKSAEMVASKTGLQVPQQFIENGKLRPEEAAAAWLGTPDGQAALDALERGEFREDLWQKGAAVRTAYGDDRHATMGSMKPAGKNQFSMLNLQGLVDEINATKGDSAKLQEAVTKLKGIGTGKQGFIGHLLGMGNVPTIDAVEINTWIAGQGDIAQLKNKRADLARRIKESSSDKRVSAEMLDRVTRRFEGLRKKVGADQVDPQVWQHIAHHWLWDRAKGIETTHGGLYEAMRFYQNTQTTRTTARGFIEISPAKDKFKITLTGKADLSTFQHEAAHYYLEVIQALVASGDASAALVADLQKIRDWMGLKEGEAIERRHHEMFARGWEAYLMEGRAPSADLQSAFNRFRAWLVFIYKRMVALDVELTDEVRGVMDRLVASEAQIAEARTNIGWAKPLPKEALFLSDDEYDRYVEAWNKASEAQQREVDAKLMLEAARETQAAWKEERQKVLEEERAKIAETRGYRAWKLLSEGQGLEDAAPGRTSLKIDPETVPPEWRRDTTGMTDEMGLPLEAVAEILGFDSGEQMISLIAGAKFAERDLPAKVKQIMADRHGDMDATALADAAMAAVHSDDTQEVLLTEFRAMAAKAGIGAPPPGLAKWMAAQAQQKVLGLTRRQLDPMRWRRAELKAATDAAKAAAKGDATKAAIHKRQQMMAAAMYRATVQADKRVDVIRRKLLPFTKNDRRAKLGKAGDTYLDGIDEILEAIQLKPMSAASVQKLDRLQKLVEEANANGEPLVLPDKLRAMLGRKNFQDMTLEELEGVHDAVMNIWHLAKLKNELKARNEKRQLEEAITEMEANAAAALGSPEIKDKFVYGWKDRAASKMREFRAGLVKMEFLFGWLDGKPDGGLMHRMIYQPIADANKAKFVIMKRFHKSIIQHMRNLPADQKARWNSKRTFLGREANGATIISAALNLGNEGNKSKLLKGYGLNTPQGEQQLMAEINAFMTKADWDFVQHIWNEIDTLWPDIVRVTKAATGLEPEKVVPTPVATPFGTYQGGYYPVVYDPAPRPGVDAKRTLKQFERQQEGEGLFSTNFVSPTLGDGFTKARVDFENPPILLDLKVISQHLSEVVHYVTHYEAVTQADKITRHPRFIKLVQGTMGDEFYKTIRPWLTDIARDQDTPAVTRTEPFAKAMRYLRGGMSIGAMGYNVFTGFKQLLGVTTSLDAVKPRYLISGLQKAWLSPNIVQNWKTAFAQSGELEPLVTQFDRDIKMINDIYAKQGIRSKFDKFNALAFAHIGWLQASVNVATWYGAKEQAIAEGLTEQQAIDRADAVVRQTQSAGAVKDLSPIQRGSEINRSVSMFYSWFNVLYNRMEDIHKQTKGARDLPKAAYRVGVLIMMTALVEETASRAYEAIVDNVDDDDDEEAGFILTVLMKSADTALAAIPLVRAFVSVEAAAGGLKPEISPVVRVGADYWRTIEAIKDLAIEQEAPSRSEVKTAMRTVSVLTHVPVSGLYNLFDEYLGEEVFGERRKQ